MPLTSEIQSHHRVEAILREHAAYMAKFEATGWSRTEASRLAYEMVKPRPRLEVVSLNLDGMRPRP